MMLMLFICMYYYFRIITHYNKLNVKGYEKATCYARGCFCYPGGTITI